MSSLFIDIDERVKEVAVNHIEIEKESERYLLFYVGLLCTLIFSLSSLFFAGNFPQDMYIKFKQSSFRDRCPLYARYRCVLPTFFLCYKLVRATSFAVVQIAS